MSSLVSSFCLRLRPGIYFTVWHSRGSRHRMSWVEPCSLTRAMRCAEPRPTFQTTSALPATIPLLYCTRASIRSTTSDNDQGLEPYFVWATH
ncbi:hypothetical protein C8R47DRAFT_1317906 [Mycena vitilis]|nr:hypothetical protein C8R47DRAFT_1317906 [Mycena vitilis]